jgi:hypothetical protein
METVSGFLSGWWKCSQSKCRGCFKSLNILKVNDISSKGTNWLLCELHFKINVIKIKANRVYLNKVEKDIKNKRDNKKGSST